LIQNKGWNVGREYPYNQGKGLGRRLGTSADKKNFLLEMAFY